MKPTKPEGANMTWKLPDAGPCDVCGGSGSEECPGCWGSKVRGDLPGIVEHDGGEVTCTTTEWVLDDGERRALANGAPVRLVIWGHVQPVALAVGEPSSTATPLLDGRHVERALDLLVARLAVRAERIREDGGVGTMEPLDGVPGLAEVHRIWHSCLSDTAPDGTSVSGRRAAG